MCPHEKSTQHTAENPARILTAWSMIGDQDGPMHHLYNLDAMITVVKLALETLQDNTEDDSLCHVYHLLVIAGDELSQSCDKLEKILREIKIND